MIDAARLSEVIRGDVTLRAVEPHIYSLAAPGDETNEYDGVFGAVYDRVACSGLYNRLVWGYRTRVYHSLCLDALRASSGWMLDAGCGSLAFTARTYAASATRPVVLLDQSVSLLRMAKRRLVQANGRVPGNVVFLHGDVLRLPFAPGTFTTVLALNLLHVLPALPAALREFRRILTEDGGLTCTTLVKGARLADRYLDRLAKAGLLRPRSIDQVLASFDEAGMQHTHGVEGNLAIIHRRVA